MHDSTAVSWAHRLADGRVIVRGWRVRKLKATAGIDACVACVMACTRAAQDVGGFSSVMALDRLEAI